MSRTGAGRQRVGRPHSRAQNLPKLSAVSISVVLLKMLPPQKKRTKYKTDDVVDDSRGKATHGLAQRRRCHQHVFDRAATQSLKDECAAMRDGAWATAEFLLQNASTPLKRDDPSTHGATKLLQRRSCLSERS